MFCTALLSKKLICQTLTSKLAATLVYHGLIRALLSLALNIKSVQLTLAAGKDQLTPRKSGRYFIYLFFSFTLCFFIKHYHYFWCWEFIKFCFFVLVCFAFFVLVLLYFYFSLFFFSFVLLLLLCVFLFLFLSFWFELFSLQTFSISLLFISPYSSYQL